MITKDLLITNIEISKIDKNFLIGKVISQNGNGEFYHYIKNSDNFYGYITLTLNIELRTFSFFSSEFLNNFKICREEQIPYEIHDFIFTFNSFFKNRDLFSISHEEVYDFLDKLDNNKKFLYIESKR